jgi:D-alanyl-D-alanine dipeptidase
MKNVYKNGIFPFVTIFMALLLCMPLLGINTTAAKTVPNTVSKAVKPVSNDDKFTLAGLVDLEKMNAGFAFEIRYATTNNFTGTKLYNEPRCFLRKETADKLAAANKEFMAMGLRIKIFDAYRPVSIQKILYSKVPSGEKNFIANPYTNGSNHNRGAAVDITIERLDGQPLAMPTDFDTFSYKARIIYKGCSEEQIKNRELLAEVMVRHGFKRLSCEWWHFDDSDASNYGLLDLSF